MQDYINCLGYDKTQLTLRNDYAFKWLFGKEENKDILIALLSIITGIKKEDLQEITVENTYLSKQHYTEKTGILDIKAVLKNGKRISIEMQNKWQTDYAKRVLFYWSKRYIENFKQSQAYRNLNKTILITLLNEIFPYSDKVHSIYKLLEEKEHTPLDDILEIHFLDMTKIQEYDLSELEKWLLFIKTTKDEVREMLAEKDKTMKKANEALGRFWSNKEEREKYEAEFRYECDMASLREDGIDIGMRKGIGIGRQDEKIYIAKNMINKHMDINLISQLTDLSVDEIMRL